VAIANWPTFSAWTRTPWPADLRIPMNSSTDSGVIRPPIPI